MELKIPKLNEFIGNKSQIEKLKNLIESGTPVLITGRPGIGKTSLVYAIADELGMDVVEVNASDERNRENLELLLRRARLKSLTGKDVIYLIDEADGVEDKRELTKLIKGVKNPIVLTANEGWKLDLEIETINLQPPNLEEIAELIKKLVPEGDLNKICYDVRHSIITTMIGGERYSYRDTFRTVEEIFRQHKIPSHFDLWLWFWVLDNIPKYKGKKLFEAVQTLAEANLYRKPEMLKFLPRLEAKIEYPRILRKI